MHWAAAALVVLLAQAAASQSSVPQFRTRTELVQVDVVVVDSEGRPVRGLTPANFQLLDDGRPRAIETFAEVANDAGAATVLPAPEPGVADNTAARTQRLVVLLIHDLGLWQERLEKNQQLARRVVRDLGPRVSMAVVFSSGRGGIE